MPGENNKALENYDKSRLIPEISIDTILALDSQLTNTARMSECLNRFREEQPEFFAYFEKISETFGLNQDPDKKNPSA